MVTKIGNVKWRSSIWKRYGHKYFRHEIKRAISTEIITKNGNKNKRQEMLLWNGVKTWRRGMATKAGADKWCGKMVLRFAEQECWRRGRTTDRKEKCKEKWQWNTETGIDEELNSKLETRNGNGKWGQELLARSCNENRRQQMWARIGEERCKEKCQQEVATRNDEEEWNHNRRQEMMTWNGA